MTRVCFLALAVILVSGLVTHAQHAKDLPNRGDRYECINERQNGEERKITMLLNEDTNHLTLEFTSTSGKQYTIETIATRYNRQFYQVKFDEPGTHWMHVFDFDDKAKRLVHRGWTTTSFFATFGTYQCKLVAAPE